MAKKLFPTIKIIKQIKQKALPCFLLYTIPMNYKKLLTSLLLFSQLLLPTFALAQSEKSQEYSTETSTITDSSNPVTNYGAASIGSLIGIGRSLISVVEGVGTFIISPLQSTNSLAQALINYDVTAQVIVEGMKGRALAISQVDNSSFISFYNSSMATTQTITDVCTVVCTLGAGATFKGSQLAKVTVNVSNATEKANALVKITEVLRAGIITKLSNALIDLGKARNAEELIQFAKNSTLREVGASSDTVHVLYGTVNDGRAVFDKVTYGWAKEVKQLSSTETGILATSPDKLSTIMYRPKSTFQAKAPFKDINATLDTNVLDKTTGKIIKTSEIKFAQ